MRPIDLLTDDIKSNILAIAREDLTVEACGYVLTNGTCLIMDNLAEDKACHFAMAEIELATISFVWHSHTDESAQLSFEDVDLARLKGVAIACCDPHNDDWDLFDPNHWHPFPLEQLIHDSKDESAYLNWRFEWGRSDCYAIAQYWYRGILGIEIGDSKRHANEIDQWVDGWDRFNQELPAKGFGKMPAGTSPQQHDLILFENIHHAGAHHIGVCVDEMHFLHSDRPGKTSRLDSVAGYWGDRVNSVWRHKDV